MLPRGASIFGGVGLFGEATFAAMSLLQTLTQTIKKIYVETKQFLVTRGISDLVTKDCNLSIFNSVNRMESVGVKWEKKNVSCIKSGSKLLRILQSKYEKINNSVILFYLTIFPIIFPDYSYKVLYTYFPFSFFYYDFFLLRLYSKIIPNV